LPRIKGERWIAIGRLDYNTSGLLLFTNDGELANLLMHPSSDIDREYLVRVMGEVDGAMMDRLRKGVMLEDGEACFSDVQHDNRSEEDSINQWYSVCLMEGRNREVRRLWESQGVTVSRLKRVRFGPIFLTTKLRQGKFLDLHERDVRDLIDSATPKVKKVNPKFQDLDQDLLDDA
jgi:23S rRNA pseudouridine2605 synthase